MFISEREAVICSQPSTTWIDHQMKGMFLTHASLAVGIMLLTGPSLAVSDIALRYEDLPELVRSQNKNTLSAHVFHESAEIRRRHLKRSFFPTLRLEAGYESLKTGVYESDEQPYGDLEARLNLYRGGRDRSEEGIRQAEEGAASAAATKSYRHELFKARQAFWELVHVQEVAGILKEFIDQNKRNIAGAQKRAARGVTTETDRLGFQLMDLELTEELESQNHEVVLIQAELAPLIGVSEETTIQTVHSVAHEHRSDLLDVSIPGELVPDILAARSNRQIAESQRKSSLSLWKPTVDLYGGYYLYTLREREYLDRENRDDTAVGVKALFHLFDGLQSKNQADSLSLQAAAYAAQSDYLENKLKSDLLILKEELRHLDDLVHSSEKQIEIGKKYLARTMDEYDRGVKNAPDVTSAFEKNIHLRRQYAERRRDYKRAEAKLLEFLGQ